MNQPTEEQKEQLVKFIEQNVIFFDSYSNWVFLLIGLTLIFLMYVLFKRVRSWLIRIPVLLSLLFVFIVNGLFALLINKPLRPFIKSMATINRSINNMPPDFQFKNVRSGETLQISSFKGRVILLNFWGTYCGPCIEEMPDLKKVEDDLKGDLIVISLSDETEDKIMNFLNKHEAPGMVGYFSKGDWITLGTFRPLTVYIDKRGNVREYFFGKSDYATFKSIAMKYI